jgi:hypothetical protein
MAYGNGKLWVGGLGARGVIAVESWKFGWWRAAPGRLRITGRRLDGPGRLTSDAGTVAEYGPKGFVASSVAFSDPGCWEITGRVGPAALTFRTAVVTRRRAP